LTPSPREGHRTPPTITFTKAPPAFSRDRRPAFQFVANRPVTFQCQVNKGQAKPCTSPFTVRTSLKDGPQSFAVTAVDGAGLQGSGRAAFTIDTKAPRTSTSATRIGSCSPVTASSARSSASAPTSEM
jgi:hypothetical protein